MPWKVSALKRPLAGLPSTPLHLAKMLREENIASGFADRSEPLRRFSHCPNTPPPEHPRPKDFQDQTRPGPFRKDNIPRGSGGFRPLGGNDT